jgi:hypothetical protein
MTDNEITCRKHILEQHARWIEQAGFNLEQDDQMIQFEISPLVSYSGEVKSLTFTAVGPEIKFKFVSLF